MFLFTEAKRAEYLWNLVRRDIGKLNDYPRAGQKTLLTPFAERTLPRDTPEKMGVSSYAIRMFYEQLNEMHVMPHGALILKNGRTISAAGWKPYPLFGRHMTNSLCKSIVGMAVGIAREEGLLELNEPVTRIFPEYVGLRTARRMHLVTVRHLLHMSSGVSFAEADCLLESDWVRGFLQSDMQFTPGERFEYNSMNTHVLAACIEKRAGQSLVEYLKPRLFEPLGIRDVFWETCPSGRVKGGWGCYLTLEEMARLGQLYLNQGVWNGRQLVPADWVAFSMAPQPHETGQCLRYGAHLWLSDRLDGFVFHGMFGQYVVGLPRQRMVIALTGGCDAFFPEEKVIELIHTCFLTTPSRWYRRRPVRGSLHAAEQGQEIESITGTSGKNVMDGLRTILAGGMPPQAAGLIGHRFEALYAGGSVLPILMQCMQENYGEGIEAISFATRRGQLCLCLEERGKKICIPLSFGAQYAYAAIRVGAERYRIGARAAWSVDEDQDLVLKVTLAFLEMASVRQMKLFFKPEHLILRIRDTPSMEDLVRDAAYAQSGRLPSGMADLLEQNAEWIEMLFRQSVNPVIYFRPETVEP